jgi:Flp pilus assembly protein TadG
MSCQTESLACRMRRDCSGGVAIIVGASMALLLGFCAIVVDVAYLINTQRFLQASADAAALAGSQFINCCDDDGVTATNTAISYSAVSGGKNARADLTVTMASGYPLLKCLDSTGVSCGPDSANALVVKEQATVPLFFAPLFGVGTVSISAMATASARGGTPKALDVMIIVDTTASMNTEDDSCSIGGASREDCALAGVRTLLGVLKPSVDNAGLMVFPGLTSSSKAPYEYDCDSSTPSSSAIARYNANPVYQIVGLSNDYRASDSANSLNPNSDIVLAARGGDPGCQEGLTAIGGQGTFYADVITAAQQALTTNGRLNVQKAIIFLSDGDASSGSAPNGSNECHQGINAAQAAAAAGTWVYSIAYGASTDASGSCSTDSPRISACSAMQQIASDASKYYSDTTGGSSSCTSSANPVTDLNQIFGNIGVDLTNARLLPDSTS